MHLQPGLLCNITNTTSRSPQQGLASSRLQFTEKSLGFQLEIQLVRQDEIQGQSMVYTIQSTCSKLDLPLPTVPITPIKSPGASFKLRPASMNCSLEVVVLSSFLCRKHASFSSTPFCFDPLLIVVSGKPKNASRRLCEDM